jgi:hypothetical protein
VSDIQDNHEAHLTARTDTLEGEVNISGRQNSCCSAAVDQRLEYQRPKSVPRTQSAVVQRLNIQINVSGYTAPMAGLEGTLTGIYTARYLVSRERTGYASLTSLFARKPETDRWKTSLYALGFNTAAENIHSVKTEMDGKDSVLNEEQKVDLTPYLRGFDSDELSMELDLHIGKVLTIGEPLVIPDWEDIPDTALPDYN